MNMLTRTTTPSADFPFESNYVDVLGSQMHYVDVGSGEPVLFLHGNPMSSYLWRNIIPHLEGQARCIAPDLIGMGRSDHPDIPYRYDDHYRYLCAFIDALDLGDQEITLVIHDWGSGLGFRWAADHPERIKAVCFMEAMVSPLSMKDLPLSIRPMFPLMRTRFGGWLMGQVANMFLRVMIQDLTYAKLGKDVLAHYRSHYPTIASRRAVAQWPAEVPFDGKPADNYAIVMNYRSWLEHSDVPKLMFHGDDGVAIKAPQVAWCKQLKNIEVVDLGPGKHFLQETHPEQIGGNLARWYAGLA